MVACHETGRRVGGPTAGRPWVGKQGGGRRRRRSRAGAGLAPRRRDRRAGPFDSLTGDGGCADGPFPSGRGAEAPRTPLGAVRAEDRPPPSAAAAVLFGFRARRASGVRTWGGGGGRATKRGAARDLVRPGRGSRARDPSRRSNLWTSLEARDDRADRRHKGATPAPP